jgi:hypothetical protein
MVINYLQACSINIQLLSLLFHDLAIVFDKLPQLQSLQRQPLLGNGSENMPVDRQWLDTRHMMAAMLMYATTEELLAAVFSVWSAGIC